MDGVFESYYLPRVLAPQDIAARAMAPITLIPFEEARRAALRIVQIFGFFGVSVVGLPSSSRFLFGMMAGEPAPGTSRCR